MWFTLGILVVIIFSIAAKAFLDVCKELEQRKQRKKRMSYEEHLKKDLLNNFSTVMTPEQIEKLFNLLPKGKK